MLAGRYKILQIVGEGATSTVYRAFDTKLGQEVAIKAISLHSSQTVLPPKEYTIHSELKHEHITRLLDCIQTQNSFYLISELCSHNLLTLLNEYDIEKKGIKRVMRMALLGLAFIHSNGIIHRDIKLSNILISDDILKLCDFGLAIEKGKEGNSRLCGTRDYLAPELLSRNANYSEKTDIYALGVVFKALVTRRKDSNLSDIQDAEFYDFGRRLLSDDPSKRCTAAEALEDTFFKDLRPNVPNFRLLRPFKRTVKRGVLSVSDRIVEIRYKEREKTNTLAIECLSSEGCKCRTPFQYIIKINNIPKKEELLTESQLKYFNYLCAYLHLHCDKTEKRRIEETPYTFVYYLSGRYVYKRGPYSVSSLDSNIPYDDKLRVRLLLERCTIECICSNFPLAGTESTASLSIMDDIPLGGRQRIFIHDKGWCLRDNLCLNFFLNTGQHFSIQCDSGVIKVDTAPGRQIKPGLPKEVKENLLLARSFILEMLRKMV